MENDLRHYVRRCIPLPLWRTGARLLNASSIIAREGVSGYRCLAPLDGREITRKFANLRHPFTFRRTGPNVSAIVNNIIRGEYDGALPPNPTVIIDGGAYIGDLTCLWATRFPNARIFGFEPNPTSGQYAVRNTAPYGDRVTIVNKGLWSSCGALGFSGNEMDFSLRASEATDDSYVPVVDMETFMREQGISHIEILKLDVEGAEKHILGPGCESWVRSVGVVMVECHGAEIERAVTTKMNELGFIASRKRSIIFFTRR